MKWRAAEEVTNGARPHTYSR